MTSNVTRHHAVVVPSQIESLTDATVLLGMFPSPIIEKPRRKGHGYLHQICDRNYTLPLARSRQILAPRDRDSLRANEREYGIFRSGHSRASGEPWSCAGRQRREAERSVDLSQKAVGCILRCSENTVGLRSRIWGNTVQIEGPPHTTVCRGCS